MRYKLPLLPELIDLLIHNLACRMSALIVPSLTQIAANVEFANVYLSKYVRFVVCLSAREHNIHFRIDHDRSHAALGRV